MVVERRFRAPEHPGIFKKLKNRFVGLKKLKKDLDVADDASHKYAKNRFQILRILGYRKMTKIWI